MDASARYLTVEGLMNDQHLLASLALVDDVRTMHQDLEQLYRAQLGCMELAERLGGHID